MTYSDFPGHLSDRPSAVIEPTHDFSIQANGCGPCPSALHAVRLADVSRVPDASCTALLAQLATLHGVETGRVLLVASASDFTQRLCAIVALLRGPHASACLPRHHDGDAGRAATVWGLHRTDNPAQADLLWVDELSSPLGQPQHGLRQAMVAAIPAAITPAQAKIPVVVLDCTYAPLRLEGVPSLDDAQRDQVWQLWVPGQALGLPGISAAYVIAPVGWDAASEACFAQIMAALRGSGPASPAGAHGAALLQAWCRPEVLAWLHASLDTLRDWKARQWALLSAMGWVCLPSDAPYFCARPNVADVTQAVQTLQAQGIALCDADPFGLPGHVRIGVQPPESQDALVQAWSAVKASALLVDTLRHMGRKPSVPAQAPAVVLPAQVAMGTVVATQADHGSDTFSDADADKGSDRDPGTDSDAFIEMMDGS